MEVHQPSFKRDPDVYEAVRFELLELYSQFAPQKIHAVDKILKKYTGLEYQVLEAARAKYLYSFNNDRSTIGCCRRNSMDSCPKIPARRSSRDDTIGGIERDAKSAAWQVEQNQRSKQEGSCTPSSPRSPRRASTSCDSSCSLEGFSTPSAQRRPRRASTSCGLEESSSKVLSFKDLMKKARSTPENSCAPSSQGRPRRASTSYGLEDSSSELPSFKDLMKSASHSRSSSNNRQSFKELIAKSRLSHTISSQPLSLPKDFAQSLKELMKKSIVDHASKSRGGLDISSTLEALDDVLSLLDLEN